MNLLLVISVLLEIACFLFQVCVVIGYFGLQVAIARSAWKYRCEGWQMGILLSFLGLTLPIWVVGSAYLFEALNLTSPLAADFVP